MTPRDLTTGEAEAWRAGWAAAREAAAMKVRGMRKCPFEDPKFSMDPATPCPICGDVGDDLNAPVRCSDPAAAIRAMEPPA